MASPRGSTRAGATRGRALFIASATCALALAVLVALLSRRDAAGPTPAAAEPAQSVAREPLHAEQAASATTGVSTATRETVEDVELAARAQDVAGGPLLVGRVLDERGRALADVSPRVALRGPLDQRLVAPVDANGDFGPLRLPPGRWSVVAEAEGRRSAQREVELADGVTHAPLELVLPRITRLDVFLVAYGPGRRGDAVADLAGLAPLLSTQLAVEGEEKIERRSLTVPLGNKDGGPSLRARFESPADRAGTLELHLGLERVLQRTVAAGQEQLELHVDPLELLSRLIELDVELRDPHGRPLERIGGVLLAWGESVHLVAHQPGKDPWRVRFSACPPGAARLVVVDVDGRRREVELRVPFDGPARLEVALEPVPPR